MLIILLSYIIGCILALLLDLQDYIIEYVIALNTVITLSYCLYIYKRNKNIMDASIVLNSIGYLYTNYTYFFSNSLLYNYYSKCLILAIVSICSFNLSYLVTKKLNFKRNTDCMYNYSFIGFSSTVLLIIGLSIEIYFIIYIVGFDNFISMTRSARTLLLLDSLYVANFYKPIITLSCLLSTSHYICSLKHTFLQKVTLVLGFTVSIYNSIISVSRADFVALVIPLIYILYIHDKISRKQVIGVCLLILSCLSIWKFVFTKGLSLDYSSIQMNSELESWVKIGNNIINDLNNGKIDYLLGTSYVDTLINILYPFTGIEALSEWYVRIYEYSVYITGGGRGFSGIIEAYYNFGIFGCVLVFMLYGMIYKKIFSRTDNPARILIQAVLLSLIYKVFRSEAYSLWKNAWWLQILPIIIIFKIAEIKVKNHGK